MPALRCERCQQPARRVWDVTRTAIVHAARENGYAFNFGAFNRESGSFAVPVFDGRGIFASLGANCGEEGPTDEAVAIAKDLALRASRELGYRVSMRFAIG